MRECLNAISREAIVGTSMTSKHEPSTAGMEPNGRNGKRRYGKI
jgi:hypothetical protein